MRDWDLSRLSRRRFVVTSAMGVGAASLAGVAPAQARDTGDHSERGTGGLADAVLAAFARHRLVAIGEIHGLQEHHDLLVMLLTDPRLPAVVDAVLVEGGNSLYQDTVDRYVGGFPVQNADLRQVWRDTTNSPLATGDEPITEHFYRTIRAVNWRLPAGDRIRVLLGDPPIDWPKITAPDQVFALRAQRDTFAASLVKREVLDKGGRALICYGSGHVFHAAAKTNVGPPGVVSLLEQQTGERVYSIATLAPLGGDPGGLGGRLSPYRRGSVIPTAGTWLGAFNAGQIFPVVGPGPAGQPVNVMCGISLGSLLDAGLYPGQAGELTMSRPNPAIYLDEPYWAELQRRNALQGGVVHLDALRQEQPVRFTPQTVPPSLQCP